MSFENLALPFVFPELSDSPETENTTSEIKTSQLWLCIYFSNLSLDILNTLENKPQCVVSEFSGRWVVHRPCELAAEYGIVQGMPLNAAYALCSDLRIYHRELEHEQEKLKVLANWVYQFSSMVTVVEPQQSLLLEIRGSLQLFGGLSALLEKIKKSLQAKCQYELQMSVAPTPLAAQLFSQTDGNSIVEHISDLRSALGGFPIHTLLLNDHKLLKKLSNIGVSCLQDLWRLPRDGLARRFGQTLVNHLDQLLGERPDPQYLYESPLEFDASVELPMEAANHKSILIAAEQMLIALEKFLRVHDAGMTQLFIRFYHYDHPPENLSLGFRQNTRSADHMLELLQERLGRVKLLATVTEVRLMVKELIPFTTHTNHLFASQVLPSAGLLTGEADPEWEATLEQLQNRLGEDAVLQLQVVDDHRPEFSWAYGTPLDKQVSGNNIELRPNWILPQARHLIVRNGIPWLRGPLSFLRGPERIEAGWWEGEDIRRDYYMACDIDNSRLWIFRDLRQKDWWFLQGYF